MHPLVVVILLVLALYACGKIEAPQTDREAQAQALRVRMTAKKIPDRLPMTEAEKRFGCRFADTVKDAQGRDTGECP